MVIISVVPFFFRLTEADFSHANTWPSSFMLTATAQAAVSTQDLQLWVKKTQPALCTFAAQPRIADPKTNELHYRSLITLLLSKKVVRDILDLFSHKNSLCCSMLSLGGRDPEALKKAMSCCSL